MAHRCNHCQATCIGHRTSEPQPSPDIARLLATNDPPSAKQQEDFLRYRVEGVKRLAELETIIAESQQALEGAMAERDALTGNLKHHRLVLNPVRRLPADVLREIFLFACARISEEPFRFHFIPPSFLAAVCRSWHDIAVTFPQLWRQYRFLEGYRSKDSDMMAHSLSVSRSAMCPLWLDLHLDVQTLSYSNPVYPFLLCISGRIQRLRVSIDDLRLLESPEFRYFVNGLTTLVQFDVFMEPNDSDLSATVSLPRTLRHLAITPFDAFLNPKVDFKWAHLQSLVLRRRRDTTARSMLNILAKTCNLRRLTFSNDDNHDDPVPWQSEPIIVDSLVTIPPLTDLIVEGSTPSNVYDVLAYICTPSLKHLMVRTIRISKPLMKKGSLNHQHRKARSVRVYDVDGLEPFIRGCGSLRELSLLDIGSDTQSVRRLLSSMKESLPQLRILAVDISSVNNLSFLTQEQVAGDILAFLESRRNIRVGHAPDLDLGTGPPRVDLESFTLHAPSKEVFDFTDVQHRRIELLHTSGLLFYVYRYSEKDPRMF